MDQLFRGVILKLRLYGWLAWWLSLLPSSRHLNRLRGKVLSLFLNGSCGNLSIGHGFHIPKPWLVTVGDHVAFNAYVMILPSKRAPISIGDHTIVGPFTVFRSADHRFDDLDTPIRYQGHTRAPIIVENDCWIASSVTITKGVKIGAGSIIGANSVVTRSIPPRSVAVGVPAHVIRRRGSGKMDDESDEHRGMS